MVWGADAFDVIFMDPPYAEVREGAFAPALARAVDRALGPSVRKRGRVVLEHAKGAAPPAMAGLTIEHTRTYGDTALSFYLR
jgi:16S rRNA G966 N2-methylase RsmD